MRASIDPFRLPWPRRLVLAMAAALAVALALALPGSPDGSLAYPVIVAAHAATAATDEPLVKGEADAAAVTGEPTAPAGSGVASEVTIDNHGITIHKNGKRVSVQGMSGDREYDSFEDFVHDAPWLAALVFLVVLLLFLTPLLIAVLVIWYKVRKTRMQNEVVLKLAEKGVVPAEAAASLGAAAGAPAPLPPGTAPLYEQVRQLRRRAAWSDLRRGIVLIAIGLAFSLYSIINEQSANWVGLICLFLGVGYFILWFLEDRPVAPAQRDAGPPSSGSS